MYCITMQHNLKKQCSDYDDENKIDDFLHDLVTEVGRIFYDDV